MSKLTILVFSCSVVDKYRRQMKTVIDTWYQEAWELGVECYFFCGEVVDPAEASFNLIDPGHIVHLPGVADDYESATDKQWLGLKWMHDHHPSDFVLVCGTDNYVDVNNMNAVLQKYNPSYPFIISGKQQSRSCAGVAFQVFPLGGCGLVFSKAAVDTLYDKLTTLKEHWRSVNSDRVYHCAVDVAAAYYAEKYHIVLCRDYHMYTHDVFRTIHWNHDEGDVDYHKVATFHFMDDLPMRLYHRYRGNIVAYISLKKLLLPASVNVTFHALGLTTNNYIIDGRVDCNQAISLLLGIADSLRDNVKVTLHHHQHLRPYAGALKIVTE